jgi:hypothetical protein
MRVCSNPLCDRRIKTQSYCKPCQRMYDKGRHARKQKTQRLSAGAQTHMENMLRLQK